MFGVRRSVFGVFESKIRRLLELFDLADDLIEIRPVAGLELGMEELAIGVDLKCPTARWNEGERFDPLAEFEDFRRQTDGLRRVVSNHAVFNRDFGFHLVLLSGENGTKSARDGQASRCNCCLRCAPAAGRTGSDGQNQRGNFKSAIASRGRRFAARFRSARTPQV